jgi:hypothetical protein
MPQLVVNIHLKEKVNHHINVLPLIQEMKIRMICKYEYGQSLTAITCELDFVVSTVNTIMKNATCTKECVKGAAMMKSMIIKK